MLCLQGNILSILWPKNWIEVQSLLGEEGFVVLKECYICICRENRTFIWNGKTSTKYQYSCNGTLCKERMMFVDNVHCGKEGYVKYYYLGLHPKIKNWFRSDVMWKRMLSDWEERELGRTSSWLLKKVMWGGQRWIDLQWFWDLKQT